MKIADGEYGLIEQSNFGAIGPFGEEVYDFHETWTIWRTAGGAYEVEGRRKFDLLRIRRMTIAFSCISPAT